MRVDFGRLSTNRSLPELPTRVQSGSVADKRHHVRYRQTALDVFGSHVTRLSGDDVTLDEPALLLLALRRAGHISSEEAARLHGDYLRAKYE